MRMQREIHELARSDVKRHGEPIAYVAWPGCHPGHIDRQDQHLIASGFRAVDQAPGGLQRASDIELKPGQGASLLGHGLERARRGGGNTMGHAASHGFCGQHLVGAGPGQVAHAHGCDAKRQPEGLAQKRLLHAALFRWRQHAWHQLPGVQCLQVTSGRALFAGGTINVVKHQARQASAGQCARLVAGVDWRLAYGHALLNLK